MPLTDPGHRVARSPEEKKALEKQEGVTYVALVGDYPRAVYSKKTGRMSVAHNPEELADFKKCGWATTKEEIHKLLDARVAAERAEDDSPIDNEELEGVEVGNPSKAKRDAAAKKAAAAAAKESGKEA